MSKLNLIAMLLLMSCSSIAAQELKLAGIEYANYPKVNLKDDADGFEASFQEFGGFVGVPTVLMDKQLILVNSLSYGMVKSTLENPLLGIESTQTYHRISYSMVSIIRVTEQWMLMTRLAPTLASDFDQPLSEDDFMMLGSVIATKTLNERVRIGGGVVYTTRLGRPLLLPMFQYAYKKDKHHFSMFLPAFIHYSYVVGKDAHWTLGMKVTPNGANFNAYQDTFAQIEVDKLNYVRVNIGPEVTYRLTEMLRLELAGGLSTKRMYKYFDNQGDGYNYNSNSGVFFKVGLTVVPPDMGKK